MGTPEAKLRLCPEARWPLLDQALVVAVAWGGGGAGTPKPRLPVPLLCGNKCPRTNGGPFWVT